MDKEMTPAEKEALNKQKGREASQAAKKLRVKRIDALLKLLQQTFPHAFSVPYKPLTYAIAKDIIDDWKTKEDVLGELSKKCLRETLHFYTSRIDYHKACLAPKVMRVDLKGSEVSPVTDEEKIYHQQCLDTLTELQKKWAE